MGCVFGKPPPADDDPDTGGASKADPAATASDIGVTTWQSKTTSIPSAAPKDPFGWPTWLATAAGDALKGWAPRGADSFQKLDKIGQGTYSNVYKARDLMTGKVVALKKVRFDITESESVRFMAREISVLRRLDHPNIVKLEGLVTSRVSNSIYLILEYMEHDLAGLAAYPGIQFTEPQVKCYMKQLLSGLEHCHKQGVLHRDIKGSNLLIDNEGVLKIADFGLASTFDPDQKQPMTSRVVTLWYRPPELLLGATHYGVGVDLWSAGCILAELLAGKPILPGRTEVEQLHRIFKLCGSPSEKYWKKSKLPHATMFKPQQPYQRHLSETYKDFPPSSLPLIETLLAIDPDERGTATGALNSEFFTTEPYACEPSSLPHYPPSKERDAKLRDEKDQRQQKIDTKGNANGTKKSRIYYDQQNHERRSRAGPAPEANAELQGNLNRRRIMVNANATSKSEKFPPPHQDGAFGMTTASFAAPDEPFASSLFESKVENARALASLVQNSGIARRKRSGKKEPQATVSENFSKPLKSPSIGLLVGLRTNARIYRKTKGKELEVFGARP